jgi:uncharacterized membrane protein
MSSAQIGALFGLFVAALDYLFLRALARRVELAETKRALHVAGLSQFVLLPVIGWFAAPYLLGE